MGMNTIDAKTLKKAFLAGAQGLEAKKEWINELNVFPVPDGDTGTNMTMTIMAAAKEVAALEEPTMDTLAKAIRCDYNYCAGRCFCPGNRDGIQGSHEAQGRDDSDRCKRYGGEGSGAGA